MHTEVSVKNPTRAGWSSGSRPRPPRRAAARTAGSSDRSPSAQGSPSSPSSCRSLPVARSRGSSVSTGARPPTGMAPDCPSGPPAVLLQLRSSGPRGRRPGRMSHVDALLSWMWVFGSRMTPSRSLPESPGQTCLRFPSGTDADLVHDPPPLSRSGRIRSVTSTRLHGRAAGHDRRPAAVLQPAPRPAAGSPRRRTRLQLRQVGQRAAHRPAVWCSVSR